MIAAIIGGVSLFGLGFFMTRRVGIASSYYEAVYCKPSLIRETSRLPAGEVIRHPIKALQKWAGMDDRKSGHAVSGMILAPELEKQLIDVAGEMRREREYSYHSTVYKTISLCGPPGTGKTMYAKQLAQSAGMDYAILSGQDLISLRQDGATAVHKVFDWASMSSNDLLLLLDDADLVLGKKISREPVSENIQDTINAFLYRIDHISTSERVKLVLASNKTEKFTYEDVRIRTRIEFQLPGIKDRELIINSYFKKFAEHLDADKWRAKFLLRNFPPSSLLVQMVEATEGLSPEELSNLVRQIVVYASDNESRPLTMEVIIAECLRVIEPYKQKVQSRSEPGNRESIIYAESGSSKDSKTPEPEKR